MPDFEPRAGQMEMAAAVARVFEHGGVLLAEAGTGTGKTLAYLVPAILSRERVLISTGTKNLQEQIFFKDIPALREALGIPFTATCMKGRANYLCLHKLDQLADGASPQIHDVFLPMIREWSTRTETGDRADLEDLPEDLAFWNDVSATADTCLGTECPRYDDCFVTRMRQRAAASDVVIVNHHLLCADAAVRQNNFGEVIPACSRAILDEAHQLEDIATQYFGFSVSNYRFEELARDEVGRRDDAVVAGFDRPVADMRHRLDLLVHAGRHRIAWLGAGDVGHRPSVAGGIHEPDRLGVAGHGMRRELAVRPGRQCRIVDDQAADRREGQHLRSVHDLYQLLALGHDLARDAAEDRLAVLRNAAVDDHEMADALGHPVRHQAGDQAAEAVADQHDVAQVFRLQGFDGVGQEDVIVERRRKLGRALADAAKRQGARVVARCHKLLQHELPRPGPHPGPGKTDVRSFHCVRLSTSGAQRPSRSRP